MDSKLKIKYQMRAELIKALAHPTRLFIVDELAKESKCVCELTEMIGDDMSTISKHLSILKSAGIIESEKRGTQVYYKLKMQCVLNFFMCVETMIQEHLKEQMKIIEGKGKS